MKKIKKELLAKLYLYNPNAIIEIQNQKLDGLKAFELVELFDFLGKEFEKIQKVGANLEKSIYKNPEKPTNKELEEFNIEFEKITSIEIEIPEVEIDLNKIKNIKAGTIQFLKDIIIFKR